MNYKNKEEFVSVMWIDMKDSRSLFESVKHEKYSNYLQKFYDIADFVLKKYDLKIMDYLGDGFSVVSKKGEVDDLINCFFDFSKKLHTETGLSVRAGVDFGKVIFVDIKINKLPKKMMIGIIPDAFQLESGCKILGIDLTISKSAYQRIQSKKLKSFFVKYTGVLKVKGKIYKEIYLLSQNLSKNLIQGLFEDVSCSENLKHFFSKKKKRSK